MRYLGQERGGVTPATPLKEADFSMSLGGMGGITARPTKYTSLTLVGLQNFGPEIPGLPSDYLLFVCRFYYRVITMLGLALLSLFGVKVCNFLMYPVA